MQPHLARQIELEADRDRAQEARRAARTAKEQVTHLSAVRDAHWREEQELRAALPKLDQALAQRQKLTAARDKANDKLLARRAEYARLHAEIEAQRAALTAVERGERTVCPACQRPFEGGDVQSFVHHLSEQMHACEAEAAAVERRGKRLRQALTHVDELVVAAEQRVQGLREGQAKLVAVRQIIAATDEQMREAQERAATLAGDEGALGGIEGSAARTRRPADAVRRAALPGRCPARHRA